MVGQPAARPARGVGACGLGQSAPRGAERPAFRSASTPLPVESGLTLRTLRVRREGLEGFSD